MTKPRTHLAIYPGSFDPLTFGHLDVVERARRLFDRLVVAVGHNPGKAHLFSLEERIGMAHALVEEMTRREPDAAHVEIVGYEGLTIDCARELGAHAIIRGVRNLADLQSEVQHAITNREVGGLETVFVVAGPSFAYTSSSLIKQITAMGDDLSVLSGMCPPIVIEGLREKKRADAPLLRRLRGADNDDA